MKGRPSPHVRKPSSGGLTLVFYYLPKRQMVAIPWSWRKKMREKLSAVGRAFPVRTRFSRNKAYFRICDGSPSRRHWTTYRRLEKRLGVLEIRFREVSHGAV